MPLICSLTLSTVAAQFSGARFPAFPKLPPSNFGPSEEEEHNKHLGSLLLLLLSYNTISLDRPTNSLRLPVHHCVFARACTLGKHQNLNKRLLVRLASEFCWQWVGVIDLPARLAIMDSERSSHQSRSSAAALPRMNLVREFDEENNENNTDDEAMPSSSTVVTNQSEDRSPEQQLPRCHVSQP